MDFLTSYRCIGLHIPCHIPVNSYCTEEPSTSMEDVDDSLPYSYWRKYVHEVLVNGLGGLSLPRKSVVRLTDRPDMTLDVNRGRKTTMQHATACLIQSNLNGSNTFGTMKICSRQG